MIPTFNLQHRLQTAEARAGQGFTLIEVLVVVAIIALLSSIALPNLSAYFQLSLNSTARGLASTAKEVYNSALVTGKMYRLVYDLEHQEYWAESGPDLALLDTEHSLKKKQEKERQDPKAPPPKDSFQQDMTVSRKKGSLPQGVVFEDIITEEHTDTPITQGLAFTHFFPHGITEKTVIHLKDSAHHQATLVFEALTGTTQLYDRFVPISEIFPPPGRL